MMNFPVTYELMDQHRKQLLAEAERDRLAREATSGTSGPEHGMLAAIGSHTLGLLSRTLFAIPQSALKARHASSLASQ
jgi:hypothetical protein